jgi:hypothetical protein
MVKEIQLTKGMVALVDDEDFNLVSQFNWCALCRSPGGGMYAVRTIGPKQRRQHLSLHGFLMGTRDGLEVDHIDLNGLNCQRSNMRWATRSQNLANKRKTAQNTSGYKGVSRRARDRRWIATIYVENRPIYLGSFETREEAADAYDDAARKHYGQFARLNFPLEGEQAA